MEQLEQGDISAHTTYQHVGYLSAGVTDKPLLEGGANMTSQAGIGGGLILIALGFMVGTKNWTQPALRRGSAGAVIGLGIISLCIGVAALTIRQPTPQLLTTIQNMERGIAATDQWAEAHGRLPDREEWREIANAAGCSLDGWRRPFLYGYVPDGMLSDDGIERGYSIICYGRSEAEGTGGPEAVSDEMLPTFAHSGHSSGLTSTQLGPDGLFGTGDDCGWMGRQLIRWPEDASRSREPRA